MWQTIKTQLWFTTKEVSVDEEPEPPTAPDPGDHSRIDSSDQSSFDGVGWCRFGPRIYKESSRHEDGSSFLEGSFP